MDACSKSPISESCTAFSMSSCSSAVVFSTPPFRFPAPICMPVWAAVLLTEDLKIRRDGQALVSVMLREGKPVPVRQIYIKPNWKFHSRSEKRARLAMPVPFLPQFSGASAVDRRISFKDGCCKRSALQSMARDPALACWILLGDRLHDLKRAIVVSHTPCWCHR